VSQPQYGTGIGSAAVNTIYPPINAMCQFAYGSNNIAMYSTNVTHPYSREFVLQIPVQQGASDPISVAAQTVRGVINPQYWAMEKFIRTQGMENPDFNDSDSIDPLDYWDQEMNIAINQPQAGNAATGQVVYGSHSFKDSAGNYWNTGLHNQITTFFWAPIGYEDANVDYGIYKGNMRMIITFAIAPTVSLNMFFLHYYLIAFMMIGNGTCQTNIQLP
jgi:hypothetical protein